LVKLETRIAAFSYVRPVLICVVYRGGLWLDGVLSKIVGENLLDELVSLIKSSSHYDQVNYVMLDYRGMGFHPPHLKMLYDALKRPIIVVGDEAFPGSKFFGEFNVYVAFIGVGLDAVRKLLKLTFRGFSFPEPLRVSRMLALSLLDAMTS